MDVAFDTAGSPAARDGAAASRLAKTAAIVGRLLLEFETLDTIVLFG
jgi:hypothetical protein